MKPRLPRLPRLTDVAPQLSLARWRTSLDVVRLVAVLGLSGCIAHEDGSRIAGRVVALRSEEDVAPSVRRIEPLQLERVRERSALAQLAAGGSASGGARDAAMLALLEKAEIVPGARAVTVLPMTVEAQLGEGRFAHFLAETGRDWGTWSNLLAASRLGASLGVASAPETTLRTFDRKELRSRMRPRDARRGLPLWDDAKRAGPNVRGVMFAVPTPEQRVRFDRRIAWAFWSETLRVDAPAASTRRLDRALWARNEQLRALAPQISSAIVLDHLLGMRDRWGTEPIVVDAKAPRLLTLDLDGALDARAELEPKRKPGVAIKRVERFSRGLVGAVRSLTREALVRAVGTDEQGARILDEQQLAGVLARRDALLKHVDGLIAAHGEDRVLCWE